MNNNHNRFYSPNNGDKPSTSSMEAQNFREYESIITELLERCQTEESLPNSLLPYSEKPNFLIQDKLNYFTTVSQNIVEAKRDFLEFLKGVKEKIEGMTEDLMKCIKQREAELKKELDEISKHKLYKWDKQMSACQAAINQLNMCAAGTFCITETSLLHSSWDQNIANELQFLEDSTLKLNIETYPSVLNTLRTLGRIEHYTNCYSKNPGALNILRPKFVFGSGGSKLGDFCRPWGVCSDVTGRILVCDRSNHRIQIFNENGEFIIAFGKEGTGPGELNRPSGICVDVNCKIIVADKDNHRIQIFTYHGGFLFAFGSQGSGPGQFLYPWDVAVNKNCNIAVSDTMNHRVQLFNEYGVFITLIDGTKLGYTDPRLALLHFDSPRGLAFQPNGNLLVSDFNNHRILSINTQFTKILQFGRKGSEIGQFFRPQGIACDERGNFAVSDSKNYRVQIFDEKANFLISFGCQGNELGQFDCPQGICFHPNNNVVVVDLSNNRIQVFRIYQSFFN